MMRYVSYIYFWGFAKKGYTSLFLRQKGAHLENEKMRKQSRQKDQNATRQQGIREDLLVSTVGTPCRLSLWCLGTVKRVYSILEQRVNKLNTCVLQALDSQI